jgi:hypothetical protein
MGKQLYDLKLIDILNSKEIRKVLNNFKGRITWIGEH